MQKTSRQRFVIMMALFVVAVAISLPKKIEFKIPFLSGEQVIRLGSPQINFNLFGKNISKSFDFKQGLDIQGGMQVVLEADMSSIDSADRADALESVREVILRRVDLYGIAEPVVQTAQKGDTYRLIVELAGVTDPAEALALVGQTAQLDFLLLEPADVASASAEASETVKLVETGLTGAQLKRSSVQFDQNTSEPIVALEFNTEGAELFGKITTDHVNEQLGIFLDGNLVMAPNINQPILTGQAVITGGFTLDQAKQLSIQLNAGALPVPISVLEQRTIGASLGNESVRLSVRAGLIGLGLVMLFMILYYGMKGVLASWALTMYAFFTIAIYKIMGVTLTLPGIAGLLLSIGMAVDANILIFERMKEELRAGKPFNVAMELGFGRAWDSIKDANVATILTALVLINPLNFSFLNTSGLVRGFGITLLIGVILGLLTGVVVTRTLVRLFLKEKS